jgi:hypothetical protein
MQFYANFTVFHYIRKFSSGALVGEMIAHWWINPSKIALNVEPKIYFCYIRLPHGDGSGEVFHRVGKECG